MKSGGLSVSAAALGSTLWVLIIIAAAGAASCAARSLGRPSGVSLHRSQKYVSMDNGILKVTVAVPKGYITAISFNGIDNLLESDNKTSNRGYWDINWKAPGRCGEGDCTDWLIGSSFKIITQNENQTELSFSSRWNCNTPYFTGQLQRR